MSDRRRHHLGGSVFDGRPGVRRDLGPEEQPDSRIDQEVRTNAAAKAALGDNIEAGFWVNGGTSVDIDGTGDARLSIPLTGSKGSGTVVSRGVRDNGIWELRLVVVKVDGMDAPLVLKNEDNVAIPDGSLGI